MKLKASDILRKNPKVRDLTRDEMVCLYDAYGPMMLAAKLNISRLELDAAYEGKVQEVFFIREHEIITADGSWMNSPERKFFLQNKMGAE